MRSASRSLAPRISGRCLVKHWTSWMLALVVLPPAVTVAAAHPHGSSQRTASVRLTTEPNMAIIPETRVYYLRDEADYDLYRYGNAWYLVENGTWYRSGSWRGAFVAVRPSAVPMEILTIPAGYRRGWVSPASMGTPESRTRRPLRAGEINRGAPVLTLAPRMAIIPNTNVFYSRDESTYDLYRYGNRWYYVERATWYRAP